MSVHPSSCYLVYLNMKVFFLNQPITRYDTDSLKTIYIYFKRFLCIFKLEVTWLKS